MIFNIPKLIVWSTGEWDTNEKKLFTKEEFSDIVDFSLRDDNKYKFMNG